MIPPSHALADTLERHVARGDFPGGIVARATGGRLDLLHPFGNAVVEPKRIPVASDTVYDVASVTKPLITTTLVLLLAQEGALSLESGLGEFYSDCPASKAVITIRDLLCHAGGLQAWYPLYAVANSLPGYAAFILNLPLRCEPRTETIYSDLGFILLADIVRQTLNTPFEKAAYERIIKPLGLQRTGLGKTTAPLEETAATERDALTERGMIRDYDLEYEFRTGVIWGETHDCNAHALGGSCGHAGLFTSTAETLLLTEEYGPRARLLSPETRRLVGENETPFGPQHRTLGWQLASSPECSAGPALNPDAIGHTGFTGTSVWHDRARDCTYVILTNRLHPRAANVNMNEIRRSIHTELATI